MLEMQPKWKNRKDKKIDYVACVAGVRKGGVGARPPDLLPIAPFPGGGGYSWEFLVGECRSVLQILTRFQTKKCNFPYPFSDQTSKIHTRFQTWPLGRNYVIIT